jgi:hypothetical protein
LKSIERDEALFTMSILCLDCSALETTPPGKGMLALESMAFERSVSEKVFRGHRDGFQRCLPEVRTPWIGVIQAR